MIVAIAFSCASGCWVILRLVNQPKKHPTVSKKRVSVAQASLITTRQQKLARQTLNTQPVFASIQPLQPITPMASRKKPVMSILPPEHKHPLDRGKESLADLVDWRKHNSLSALLQKY
jgi:hypothetical protein